MFLVYMAHVFVWHYYLIQPIAAAGGLIFIIWWISYGVYVHAYRKGKEKGFEQGYDRAIEAYGIERKIVP